MEYRVTTVDRFHGREKGEPIVELDAAAFDSCKAAGAALRSARLLCAGQRVREIRRQDGAIVVFPGLIPGLTTGVHSYTFTPRQRWTAEQLRDDACWLATLDMPSWFDGLIAAAAGRGLTHDRGDAGCDWALGQLLLTPAAGFVACLDTVE